MRATNAPRYVALCHKYFLLNLTARASIIWECPPRVNLNLFPATVFYVLWRRHLQPDSELLVSVFVVV